MSRTTDASPHPTGIASTTTSAAPDDPPGPPRRRSHWARWVLGGVALLVLAGAGTFAFRWFHSGAQSLPTSVAIDRYRHEVGSDPDGAGPTPGVYSYRGSGTETISVPPKSQSEGPGIPGTVIGQPAGCFEFRLDYSNRHWQSWDYCVRSGTLQSPSRAGYYDWDFVAFHVDDTSTFRCSRAVMTIPADVIPGTHGVVACTGSNDHLAIGPVAMRGTSTVVGTDTVDVGGRAVRAVEVGEQVTFSGGQSGTNSATTWFSASSGLPLRGTWHTVVSTASPVGHSTLDAHGDFALTSLTPRR
jgi:hypothetical protein